ncbi:MAG TPA: PilZ domain-containing protein [Candidatus Acidoferrales bacterium]
MDDTSKTRQRGRVQVEIPARIRQIAPPRNAVELTNSLDVSRNGMLFRTRGRYDLHTVVWVTLNYRPGVTAEPIEFPATVVRIDRRDDGSAEIALRFHSSRADSTPEASMPAAPPASPPTQSSTRRERTRARIALPVRVRSQTGVEETTTVDVSRNGVLFHSQSTYRVGERVDVIMPFRPGLDAEEMPARIVRVTHVPGGSLVALQFGAAGYGGHHYEVTRF